MFTYTDRKAGEETRTEAGEETRNETEAGEEMRTEAGTETETRTEAGTEDELKNAAEMRTEAGEETRTEMRNVIEIDAETEAEIMAEADIETEAETAETDEVWLSQETSGSSTKESDDVETKEHTEHFKELFCLIGETVDIRNQFARMDSEKNYEILEHELKAARLYKGMRVVSEETMPELGRFAKRLRTLSDKAENSDVAKMLYESSILDWKRKKGVSFQFDCNDVLLIGLGTE